MEMTLNSNFLAIENNELNCINGGIVIALVAIGSATYAITGGMVVGAIGTAYAIGGTAYQIYNAFK